MKGVTMNRCTYCGRTVRTGRTMGRHAIYPLTCAACSDLPAADPTYAAARSLVDPALTDEHGDSPGDRVAVSPQGLRLRAFAS